MLFIVSFLLFRQKAAVGLPTGKPNKKGRASLRSPSILNQCNIKKLLTVKCVVMSSPAGWQVSVPRCR